MNYLNKKNKTAEMSIYAAIFCFTLLIIVVPIFEFITSKQEINLIESNISSSLSDVTVQSAINNYDSIKFTSDKNLPPTVDEEKYIEAIFTKLGYTKSGEEWKNGQNIISDVDLGFDTDTYYFKLKYNLKVPYKLLGKQVSFVNAQKVSSSALINIEDKEACMHNLFEILTEEPTCMNYGKKEYICTKCGEIFSKQVPLVSHEPGVPCEFCGITE